MHCEFAVARLRPSGQAATPTGLTDSQASKALVVCRTVTFR